MYPQSIAKVEVDVAVVKIYGEIILRIRMRDVVVIH